MQKTAAVLAALMLAAAAQADDWLTGYSYACKSERSLDGLETALDLGDHDRIDIMIARRDCFLINNAARIDIVFEKEEEGKVFFSARDTAQSVQLWTWSRNIERDR